MQSNIHIISTPQQAVTVEQKLFRMRELDDSIKVLTAEYEMLKTEVRQEYFCDHDVYKTSKGLVLATYKMQVQTMFNQSLFKEEYPYLYESYQEKKEIYRFLLKK